MKRSVKEYRPAILSGLVGFGLLCILIVVYKRYYSFSEYNVSPKKKIEAFLAETYEGEFTLQKQKFYIENAYYIWEYQFADESGLLFEEFYIHPVERSLDMPGRYFFFNRKMSDRERDFFMVEKISQEYEEELQLKKYQDEVGPWSVKYTFDIKENSIEEVADVIATIYTYTFENAKNPKRAQVACKIIYNNKSLCIIGLEETDEIYEYMGCDKGAIAEYIVQLLNKEYTEVKMEGN